MFDRDGLAEDVFKNFERQAGCTNQGFACLASINTERFQNASDAVIKQAPSGTFSFGPATDGNLVRQVMSAELYSGNYWKGGDNEPYMFASSQITTEHQLDEFQRKLLPTDPVLQDALQQHFNKFRTVKERLLDLIQGSSFACNVRYLSEAYSGKTYNMQYAKGRGAHGSDIMPMFYSRHNALTALVGILNYDIPKMSMKLQSYLAAYVTTGSPNNERAPMAVLPFNKVANGKAEMLFPTLRFDDHNTIIMETKASTCKFWSDAEAAGTNILGYVPPGAVAKTSIPNDAGDPSRFYYAKA